MLDTADAAASRLSAEHMQKNLVLPFPQAADELQVQLSTASFPTLLSTARDREQSQHKVSPGTSTWTEGHCRLECPSTQPTVAPGSCWLEDVL